MGQQRPRYTPQEYENLRKEANFGCAKCGIPICTIHHIEGFDGTKDPLSKLIFLCKEHHDLADNALKNIDEGLTKEELYHLKTHPYNKEKVQHKFKSSKSEDLLFHLGNTKMINVGNPFSGSLNMISIRKKDDIVLFSAKFYDKNNNLMMEIVDNCWESETDVPDIRYSEDGENYDCWLSVKFEGKEPRLDFKIKEGEGYVTGKFYENGMPIEIEESGTLVIASNRLENVTVENTNTGFKIN